MLRPIFATLLAFGVGAASAADPAPRLIPVAEARPGQLVDLASDFARFATDTARLPEAERIKAFHARYDSVVPGYYQRVGSAQTRFDAQIGKALSDFPADRDKFLSTVRTFKIALGNGEGHFRKLFPDYQLNVPVYLVHSIDTQDGGTRDVGDRTVLFFGADVIAKIHDQSTIGPFLDHELFHVYHGRYFKECDRVWCSAWVEGLAVYVAARANPGASDRQLLLTQPRALRPEIEPRLKQAMCRLRAKFDSAGPDDYAEFFEGQANDRPFPPRYGYFLGYLLAAKIGRTRSVQEMAKLPPARVKPLLTDALAGYGPCQPVTP